MYKLCLACLLNFAEQASWTELVRQGGLSDQNINKDGLVRVEKRSFWEPPVKILDAVGTPTLLKYLPFLLIIMYKACVATTLKLVVCYTLLWQ